MNLPDCTIIECEQKSQAWFEARKGLLTASQFGDWLTKSGKVADKARLSAASKCLAEFAGYPDPPPYETEDMRRGTQMEPLAREYFTEMTGLLVKEVGFAKSKHGWFGCSPDGIICDTSAGLEIKCPRPSKLIEYIENGELPDQYKPQVHGSMAVTGSTEWHFFAWYETFPAFHIVVKRDDYTEMMLAGLKDYSKYFEALAAKIDSMATRGENAMSVAPPLNHEKTL